MLRRLIYFPYYIKNTSPQKFLKLLQFAKRERKLSSQRIFCDMLYCSFRYNISLLDYFELRFFELGKSQRSEYVGSGAIYEFQLKMNPKKYRTVLSNKILFLQKFNNLAGRKWATLDMLKSDKQLATAFLDNPSGQIVLKNANGQAGRQVEVHDSITFNRDTLLKKMAENGFDLLEEYVVQHRDLMRLSPSGLNTLRIITQLHDGAVVIIAARLRISVNSKVDNMSVGNIAAHIDISAGTIAKPAIYYDITRPEVHKHPATGIELLGFKIPFWKECLALVTEAALLIPENRSIGWDLAVTDHGPVLIEGNHNWHYFLWQMPERKGFKKILSAYQN